jgi:hypothetical protein
LGAKRNRLFVGDLPGEDFAGDFVGEPAGDGEEVAAESPDVA